MAPISTKCFHVFCKTLLRSQSTASNTCFEWKSAGFLQKPNVYRPCYSSPWLCETFVPSKEDIRKFSSPVCQIFRFSSSLKPTIQLNQVYQQTDKLNEKHKYAEIVERINASDFNTGGSNSAAGFTQASKSVSGKAFASLHWQKRATALTDALADLADADRKIENPEYFDSVVAKRLHDWHGYVSPHDAVNILQHVGSNFCLAHSVLRWAQKQPGFAANEFVIGAFIKVAGRARQFSTMAYYFEKFCKLTGKLPSVIEYSEVMKSYGEAGRLDSMLSTYESMLASGVRPDVCTFSILIRAFVKARRGEDAIKVYHRTKDFGCLPNLFICSEIIGLYGQMKKLDQAEALLKELVLSGMVANVVVYNRLIEEYCKANNGAKALSLYSEMILNGLEPNSVIFLTLIEFFAKPDDRVRVEWVLNEGRRFKGLNEFCYNAYMNMHIRQGRMKEAEDVLTYMLSNGMRPNTITYLTLFNGYLKGGFFAQAMEIINTLQRNIGKMGGVVYNSILTLCIECSSEDEVRTCLDCMEATDYWWHGYLVRLVQLSPKASERDPIWKEIEESFVKLDTEKDGCDLVMAVVAFLAKMGLSRRAMRVWESAMLVYSTMYTILVAIGTISIFTNYTR